MKAVVRFEIKVPVEFFEEDGDFIAYCPLFDVASQGETETEVRDNIVEALTAFLMTCYEMGTFDEVLKESGFEPVQGIPAENGLDAGTEYIDVPFPLIAKSQALNGCHA